MGSRRLWMRLSIVALALAAVAVAVAVPGIGKWIVAAVLAGLASALGGLVSHGADKAIMRGRDALVSPTTPAPIIVKAYGSGGRDVHVGSVPLTHPYSSPGWLSMGGDTVDLVVEATVDRAVIISKLEARVESRDALPSDLHFEEVELAEAMEPDDLRRFHVNLDDPSPRARPADDGVPDFPYTVSHLDPERFILMVTADAPGDYTWSVAVHWLCKGQSGVVIADHEGPPARFVILP